MSEARAPQLITADDLFYMPDHDHRYELIEGRLVKMPPTGGGHGSIEGEIYYAIRAFLKTHPLGTVLTGEVGFVLRHNPDTVLAPDVAFIQAGREPAKGSDAWDKFWELAPDLVVEVASPGDSKRDMRDKTQRWLSFGVQLAWVVWPKQKTIDVWQAGATMPATLTVGDTLTGGAVLPGF